MILFLLRHGDALEAGPGDDASRPLSTIGEEQARAQGRFLRQSGFVPDFILTSPLLRARRTSEIVRNEIGIGTVSISEHLTPSSDHRNIIRELNALEKANVLCVGHEPHLGAFISLLLTGERGARIVMNKGSLAHIEVRIPIHYGEGTLIALLPPPHRP